MREEDSEEEKIMMNILFGNTLSFLAGCFVGLLIYLVLYMLIKQAVYDALRAFDKWSRAGGD